MSFIGQSVIILVVSMVFRRLRLLELSGSLVMITGMGHVSMAMEDTNIMVDGGLWLKV